MSDLRRSGMLCLGYGLWSDFGFGERELKGGEASLM